MTVLELKHRVAELDSRLDDRWQLAYAQALAGIKRGLAEADRRQGTPAGMGKENPREAQAAAMSTFTVIVLPTAEAEMEAATCGCEARVRNTPLNGTTG